MKLSRFIVSAGIALGLLVVGATAVFAQNQVPGYGRSMMQAPANTNPTTPTTPVPGTTGTTPIGPGMMGNGNGTTGPGMMGNGGVMNSEDMQAAHEAMQNGNWDAMRESCQKAWEKNQDSGSQNQGNQPSSATRSQARGRVPT